MASSRSKTTEGGGVVEYRHQPSPATGPGRPAASPPVQQVSQLGQFVGWLALVIFSFALLEGFAYLTFSDPGSGVSAVTLLVYGGCLLVALAQARRGEQLVAVGIVCSGFLVAALIAAMAQPTLSTVLILAPLLTVGIALPYAGERTLRLVFITAWLVDIAVAGLSEISRTGSTLPGWYESGFRVTSVIAAVTVVLLLLWQYRTRLISTLERAQEAEEQAVYDATHDALTGLPNRALFQERLSRTMERARKDEDYLFSVLFLDLDRFKNVNDSLGHTTGDLLLAEIAGRLESCVHPTDTVARLGGDEFVVLAEDVRSVDGATRIAERLQKALRRPFWLSGHEIYTTASIGVVSHPADYGRSEDLLRDADTAMYHAKEAGKDRHETFDVEMRVRAVRLLQLETDLRRAVELEEFIVHYQPIVSLKSGGIVAFEALARWEHPERGLTLPAEFVPLAEETGLIIPMGLSVLREACRKTSRWRAKFPNHRPLGVSVNLSAVQLDRSDLAGQVETILGETGLAGRDLHLEITESAIMRDERSAALTLADLRALGVRVHVDDFGTGHSSLASLHRLPVDALKMDRLFLNPSADPKTEDTPIIQTIATLAHGLGLDVVAEGVGNPAQLENLMKVGCDYAQGFHFSRPVDAATAEAFIAAEPRW